MALMVIAVVTGSAFLAAELGSLPQSSSGTSARPLLEAVPQPDVEQVKGPRISFVVVVKNPDPAAVTVSPAITVSLETVADNSTVFSLRIALNGTGTVSVPSHQAVTIYSGTLDTTGLGGTYWLVAGGTAEGAVFVPVPIEVDIV